MLKKNILLFGISFLVIISISFSQELKASADHIKRMVHLGGVQQRGMAALADNTEKQPEEKQPEEKQPEESHTEESLPLTNAVKYEPNEAGKVIIIMFHKFVETRESSDQNFTASIPEFKALLKDLYERGFRLTGLNEYLSNSMDVPKGFVPVIFTFDDGSSGQFNLVYKNGRLTANENTAVGVMEEFHRLHPDFGLKGTFYINLNKKTFDGKGTVPDRLNYLTGEGFEIGNHTYTHRNLSTAADSDEVERELGENQRQFQKVLNDRMFSSFAWPYGLYSDKFLEYVKAGQYKGVHYKNDAILLIRDIPAPSPDSTEFNPYALPRIRAAGFKACDYDLAWWLQHIDMNDMYVSDGDLNTVTIPRSVYTKSGINEAGLGNKALVIY